MKKFLFLLTVLMCSMFSSVFAADYYIEEYNVYVTVNEDNVLNIEEEITTMFEVPKHGIIRKIPLKNEVVRNDGSSEKNNVAIKNINVKGADYTVSSSGGYKSIKIGSASTTLTGKKTYIITYDYELPRDKNKNFDELYFNIIGTEWDTYINKVNFTINMPKEFDKTKVGFSLGAKGIVGNNNMTYTVRGTTIGGSVNQVLKAGEGLTIRLELEDKYFDAPAVRIDGTVFFKIVVIAFCTFIVYTIWYRHGRDIQTVDTVEFYPPEGYNSAELGFLYRGYSNDMDVISLLIYLANKGYIKINDEKQKSLFTSVNSYSIEKIKDYDGDNASEKMFMDLLFANSNTVSKTTFERYLTSISYKVRSTIDNKENKKNIIVKSAFSRNLLIVAFIIFVIFYSILGVIASESSWGEAFTIGFLMLFYTPFWIAGFKIPGTMKIFWLGFTGFHMTAMLGGFGAWRMFASFENAILSIVGLSSIATMFICLMNMSKRTSYGAHILGKIKGFKRFLEVAEKDRILNLINDNPNYVFDILPYMYVLGVSDEYIKQFESFVSESPEWYNSNDSFNTLHFAHFMNDMVSSAHSSTVSSGSSSSGGGGSSGGGSSGGGSGGGGGSSW
ncbi:MAG: DUF2207 domain-containing protein [Clostridia bacterium]|nr:DUF2207 domain-containing protein [Clostridia bacterium]